MSYLNPNTVPVPSPDSVDNIYFQDVIGNKLDSSNGDSIYAILNMLYNKSLSRGSVYPSLEIGTTLTAVTGPGSWTPGAIVEIIPANTITSPFSINAINAEHGTIAADIYEIILFQGDSDIEINRSKIANNGTTPSMLDQYLISSPIIPANSRVRGRVAVAGDDGEFIQISLQYTMY